MKCISSDMTVLDTVAAYKGTIVVFKARNALAGECICCESLFDTIHDIAGKYGFDLDSLLEDLEAAATA